MSGAKKLVKKGLQAINVVNTGGGAQAPPAAAPAAAAAVDTPLTVLPSPILQPPAAPPDQMVLANMRREKIAKMAAGTAGRASTILARRSRARQASLDGDGGSDGGGQTYVNKLLGA